jgi:hypothetical protein
MQILRRFAGAALFVYAATPVAAQGLACTPGQVQMLKAELLFGRNIGGRLGVTEHRWAKFLAAEVTPRFPDGLTVLDGSGHRRDAARRRIVREPSKIVMIVMPDDERTRAAIATIVEAYKKRFRQQSVGVLTRPVCAAF